jgi:hypothetical protein
MDPLELLGVDLCKSIVERCRFEDAVKTLRLSKQWKGLVGDGIQKITPGHALDFEAALDSLVAFVCQSGEGMTRLRVNGSRVETAAVLKAIRTMGTSLGGLKRLTLHLGACSYSTLYEISRTLTAAPDLEFLVLSCSTFNSTKCDAPPVPADELTAVRRLNFALPNECPPCAVDCLAAFPSVKRCTVSLSNVASVGLRSQSLRKACVSSERARDGSIPMVILNAPRLRDLDVLVESAVLYVESEGFLGTLTLWSDAKVWGRELSVANLVIESSA